MSIIQLFSNGGYPATPAADANAANLLLALPLNAGYGISDASAIIRGTGSSYGIQTHAGSIDTTVSKYYGSSLLAGANDGSTKRLYTTTIFPAFGTSDFCVEGYAYIPVQQSGNLALLFSHNDTDAGLQVLYLGSAATPSGALYFSGGGSADTAHTSAGSFPTGQWNHFAVTRSGTTLRIFINGVSSLVFGGTSATNFSGSFQVNILNTPANYDNARLQDYRIYQGVAKYTSNFTPPGAMFI